MKIVTVLLAAALLLAGCGGSSDDGSDRAAPPEDSGVVVDIAIKDGKATPQGDRVEVAAGEKITLSITSDAEEEIHVHSEPEHTYQVAPGEAVSETFTVDTPGQVAVEAHHLDVTIVQLVVRP
jgi:ABC-type glycerol-3-phosphate transport system substrate-binding protein